MQITQKNKKIFALILAVLVIGFGRRYYVHHHVPKDLKDKINSDLSYKQAVRLSPEETEAKVKQDLSYKPIPKPAKLDETEVNDKVMQDLSYKKISK